MYVARGMVRSGFFASSRNTAVASKPMKLRIANRIAKPGAPDTICAGVKMPVEKPSGPPPAKTTAASSASTMSTSATSSTASTRPESSILKYPSAETTTNATAA